MRACAHHTILRVEIRENLHNACALRHKSAAVAVALLLRLWTEAEETVEHPAYNIVAQPDGSASGGDITM